jgi:tetratricopeptide (TPR) repeat protein
MTCFNFLPRFAILSANPMADNTAYPGNPSLTREAREKVLSTFRHSLNLFKAGKLPDCAVGCDFILKMDPRFAPAKQLLEMARNPSGGGDTAELEKYVSNVPTPQERVAAAAPAPDKLLIEAIEAYAARNFERAIENANRVLAVLPGNTDAREILAKAKRKVDVQPHVENFRQRALFALESGQMDEAKLNFERMRSLDPEHPQVEALAGRIGATAPAAAASGIPRAVPPPPDFFRESPADSSDIKFDLNAPAPPPVAALGAGGSPTPGSPAGPGALNDLSMDSLSLDSLSATPPASPPPTATGPAFSETPAAAPQPNFESDLWSSPSASSDFPGSPAAAPGAAAQVSPEVERLLREGEELETRGDPQGAIEVWSRIFLIDLNNPEAAARIEATRSRMADSNRRVAESLKTGRTLYESGKLKEAREKFLEVLALDENEPTARSYLNRIEEDLARPSFDLSQQSAGSDVLAEEEMPADSAQPRPSRERPERAAGGGRKPINLLVVAGALVVAIAAGAFLLFRSKPRALPSAPKAAAGAASSIEEARRLFQQGNAEEARQILAKIPPTDPQFARAQKLLATFQGAPAAASASPSTAAPPPNPPADAASLRSDAEAALAQHRYIDALKSFNLCAAAYTTDEAFHQEMAKAAGKVQEISSAVKLYNDGDYDTATPILWRLYQADRENADVRSYLVRSYYNQGVNSLQADLYDKAYDSFKEALGVDPSDALSLRQRAFAERYTRHPPDLLSRIYVKYLRPRP